MADFTFDFTQDKFEQIIGKNPNAEHWFEALCEILPDYEINTPPRVAAFLAQCAHESGGFRAIKENLNYKAASLTKVWPRYFPSMDVANAYAQQPEKIANTEPMLIVWAMVQKNQAMVGSFVEED